MENDEKWARAALTIHSITLTPEEIENLLGVKPTSSHHIGDPVSSRNPINKRTEHLYSVDSNCADSESLDKQLDVLLSLFDSKTSVIHEIMKTETIVLFCGFSSGNGQGGFALAPELLARLSMFGVPLILDLYPPAEIEKYFFDIEEGSLPKRR